MKLCTYVSVYPWICVSQGLPASVCYDDKKMS